MPTAHRIAPASAKARSTWDQPTSPPTPLAMRRSPSRCRQQASDVTSRRRPPTKQATHPSSRVGSRQSSTIAGQTFEVTITDDSGTGSLREAIENANASLGNDTVSFNIAGDGPHVIAPASPLPTITDPMIIDGTSTAWFRQTNRSSISTAPTRDSRQPC